MPKKAGPGTRTARSQAVVSKINNRGDEDVPFGYAYVNDTRIGFSTRDGLWATRPEGYWRTPTESEYRAVREALAKESWGSLIPGVGNGN